MSIEEKENLEAILQSKGYRKIESCKITYNDDYEWYKAFYDDEHELLYQIFFEFWDWAKYNRHDVVPWGVSVTISPESCRNNVGRRDLALSVDWDQDVERIERLAKDFYEFITKHD